MAKFSFNKLCDYFEYLDDLRGSGETNMFGAAPYLAREYPDLEINSAREVLALWQNTFSDASAQERVRSANIAGR